MEPSPALRAPSPGGRGQSPAFSLWEKVAAGRMRARIALGFLLSLAMPLFASSRSEIRDGRWYVDGEPFYIKAVGYAPWRPHQHPGISYTDTNRHWTELDFERIKAAHFNTVRTWDALDPEELALAKKYDLMVLQGIWLDPKEDFSDPHNQDSCVAQVKVVAEQSRDFDNILGYLVMTEPSPQAVLDTGQEETHQFFRRLKRTIQAVDPRPVSMDSWLPLAFMEHNDFDFVTFNMFAFWPKSINSTLGFAGAINWLADRFAGDRPLLIGETGGYAVSQATETASGGSGGWDEYTQSGKDLESLRGAVEGGAAGAVLVSWIDTWHYPRDPDTHDNEPWEWDGILGIPTDSRKDMEGIPRQVYHDLIGFNEAVLLEPKANHIYDVGSSVPIEVYGADNVAGVNYSLNGSDWKSLDASGRGWFQGFFKFPKLARKRQRLMIQAMDADERVLDQKEVSFLTAVLAEHVTIEPLPGAKHPNAAQFKITVLDGRYKPVVRRKVYFGFFYPLTLRDTQGSEMTNEAGEIIVANSLAPQPEDRFLYVSAGTDSPDRVRAGDMRIFTIGK